MKTTPPLSSWRRFPAATVHGLALARPYIQEKQSSLYLLLRGLKNQRVLDEARRVFYVAVTRARQRLVMSGLARQDKQGNWQGSGDSPLAWLREHYRLDLPPAGFPVSWPEPEMQVELLTAVPPQTGETARPPALPAAWDFHPEAAPYQVSFPSGLAAPPEETATRPETESAEDGDAARLRGVIMHRALQTLALGGDRAGCGLPGRRPPAGGPDRPGGRLPGRGNSGGTRGLPGGPVPGRPSCGRISPGRPASGSWKTNPTRAPSAGAMIDRLAFDGNDWWLLDYKTSRPAAGEDWEAFITRETEKYRPQLLAYREMAAKAKGIDAAGRLSGWESISPPAGGWWRCKVFGY